jgi:hypothetical protein
MYYDRGTSGISLFKTIYERRIRIKILKEKGLDRANISIPYFGHNNDEKILRIEASTYNLDENGQVQVSKVSKNSFYNKRIDKNFSQLSFAFPDVKPGSIIEYKMERESMGQIKNWYFQDLIPTRYSAYQLRIPSIFKFDIHPNVVDDIETKQEEKSESINLDRGYLDVTILYKDFTMRNLPAVHRYEYMGAVNDYLQRLEFQLRQIDLGDGNVRDMRAKWSDVVDELLKDEDFGKPLHAELTELKPVILQANILTSPDEKINYILTEIQKLITWDEEYGIYAHNGWKKTWADKKGNTGDINLAFINALNQAGIRAFPLLASTRDNGLVNAAYPFTSQFNTVLAFVPKSDGYYIIDASAKNRDHTFIPPEVVNTQGYLVEESGGKMIQLVDNKHQYKVMVATRAFISPEGKLSGECLINYSEFARMIKNKECMANRTAYIQNNFISPYDGIKLDTVIIANTTNNALPLENTIRFNTPINNSGNYSYFKIDLFSGLVKNPFLEETRDADIDFGFPQQYIIYGNYSLPDSYVFEELPKNIVLQTPDGSALMSTSMEAEANLLNTRIQVDFKRNFYEASHYPEFREFYKKMLDKLNEQIVIRKK